MKCWVMCLALGLYANAWAMGSSKPKDSIAANFGTLNPTGEEECHAPTFPKAPSQLVELEGRLVKPLRAFAIKADPMAALVESAKQYLAGELDQARAFADLSVSGRRSWERFKRLHKGGALTEKTIIAELPDDDHADSEKFLAAKHALDRAYSVLQVLHYGGHERRASLGWIAVSGEDDQPWRPVNIPSAKYPQRNVKVKLRDKIFQTRYMIAESKKHYDFSPAFGPREIPTLPALSLSTDAKVLIYVHGMSSRIEESLDLFRELKRIHDKTGENWTIVSFDIIGSSFADHVFPEEVIDPKSFSSGPSFDDQKVPALDFVEDFVLATVDALDSLHGVKSRVQAFVGGSLGGNITFRLGRRKDAAWIPKLVSWSPASIWDSFVANGDPFKKLAVRTGWQRSGGAPEEYAETEGQRREFFKRVFENHIHVGPIEVTPPQPKQWYRKEWACSEGYVKSGRMARRETYSHKFRLWNWRLGLEQLVYTHQEYPGKDSDKHRYEENKTPMLLACGDDDDFNFARICSNTEEVGEAMNGTPGLGYEIFNTGHAIHNERPGLLAHEIARFLR